MAQGYKTNKHGGGEEEHPAQKESVAAGRSVWRLWKREIRCDSAHGVVTPVFLGFLK